MNLIGMRVKLSDGSIGTLSGGEVNVDVGDHLEYGVPLDEVILVDPDEEEETPPVDMMFKGGR